MKIVIAMVVILLFIIVAATYQLGFQRGISSKQKEIESRVLRTPEKDCYTEKELEIMLFGEPQL